MERVKIFVQKIQELYYSKHPKSAIDIDLMLDYTRVMYIDLLEWRKEFAEPVHSDIHSVMEGHAETNEVASTPQQGDQKKEAKNEPVNEVAPVNDNIIQDQKEEEVTTTTNASTETADITKEENHSDDIPAQEEKESEPELVHEFPEEESITTISQEHTGISFEAPAPAEHFVAIEDTLVEETPIETHTAVEIPAPTPAEIPLPEIKAYEPTRLFDNIVETKDIRTSIGINDKYLFLNELFNNHKSNYEETLDKLNQIKTLSEAREWVKTKVAASQHWDDNDGTVQSFYALLEKHFSAK